MLNERKSVTIVLAIADLLRANQLTELQCCALLAGMTAASAKLAQLDLESFAVLINDAWHMQEQALPELTERLAGLARDVAERKN